MRNKGLAFKLIFCVLASCTAIFAVIFTYNYIVSKQILIKNIDDSARTLSLLTVQKIETTLGPIENVPKSLAAVLEDMTFDKKSLPTLLNSVVDDNPNVFGMTIAFESRSFDPEAHYFAPYFYRGAGKINFTYLGNDNYDYFNLDWYRIPKDLGRPSWSEPYYDKGGGNILMATYSVPFYGKVNGKRQFMGIVTADISLSWLREVVSTIKIGNTGYGFLLSKNGRIVTHPSKEYTMSKTVFDLAKAYGDSKLHAVGKAMIQGRSGFISTSSIITGKKCWLVYCPIPSNGWSVGLIFPQDELMADVTRLNHTVLLLGLLGFLVLWITIIFISRSITRPLRVLHETTKDIATGNLDFQLAPAKSKDEVGELSEAFVYMRDALKKYIQELTAATASRERIQSELRIAHEIQMSMLPRTFPPFPQKKEIDLYALLAPAKEVGGDFYDFFFVDENNLCLLIGDVSGKGVPAALFMAMTKILVKTVAKITARPDEILRKVNRELCSDNNSGMFVTIFCAVLDITTGRMSYTNAGHNPPILISRDKEPSYLGRGESWMAGIDENAVFQNQSAELYPGDTLCLYTDGVTEAFNQAREQYSEERLMAECDLGRDNSAEDLAKAVFGKIREFTADTPQSDDITLVTLRYKANV